MRLCGCFRPVPGQVFRPQRNRDNEGGSPSDLTLGGDRAAVQLDQFLHEGQPDAAALVRPPPCVLDPVESLEQPGHLLGGDARARCPAPAARRRVRPCRIETAISPSKVNLKALESRLRTIFSHICAVHEHRLGQRRAIDRQPQPGLLARRAEVAGEVGGERGEVGRLVRRPDPPGLDPREVQQACSPAAGAAARCGARPPAAPVATAATARLNRPMRPPPGPSISVSGVRNSWLTFEKKAVLARSSSAELLGPLPLLLVGPCVGDGGGDLTGEQIEESADTRR